MDKAIYGAEHERLCRLLRETRLHAGLRQEQVAARLDAPQSFVSKYEGGQRRLDLIELKQVCEALGRTLVEFVEEFESAEPGR